MTQYCNRCGETPAYLQEYEDYKGNKVSFYHCDDCATQAYRYFRRESRDHERTQTEARKKKEQVEQARKDREYKLSHCQWCGKKSSIYHYIYEKRTGKLTSITSNATNADNQVVFCTKEHFQSWLNKHKAKIAELLKKKGQKLEEQKEVLEELIAKQKELQKALAEELEKETFTITCVKCGVTKEGKYWTNKQDQNTFCSESCYDDYYTTEKCDDCNLKITGKSYYNDYENKTGALCQDCAEKKILADLRKKQNSSSPPPNNSPPASSRNNQSNIKCYNCKKYFNYGDNAHYFPQNPDKKWCDACDTEIKIIAEATQKIMEGKEVDINSLNISQENKKVLILGIRLKNGESVDLNKEDINIEDKKELKEFQNLIKSGQIPNNPKTINIPKNNSKPAFGYNYAVNCHDCGTEWSYTDIPKKCHNCNSKNIKVYDIQGKEVTIPTDNNPFLSWIVGGIVAVIFLITYLIWRQKKIQVYKKQGKKIPWWI